MESTRRNILKRSRRGLLPRESFPLAATRERQAARNHSQHETGHVSLPG